MGPFTTCIHFVVCILIVCNFSSCNAKKLGRLMSNKSGRQNNASNSEDRSGRSILPFMAYVKFPQDQCRGQGDSFGTTGVCMKKSACALYGGKDTGTCAFGYGTCCIITQSCSDNVATIRVNGTRLTQNSTFMESCRYEIPKQTNVCQIRLDFTQFNIDVGPLITKEQNFGDCSTDTLTISGNTNAMFGPLCGNLDGQHMYLNYGSNNKINIDIYLMENLMQKWNIMVTMIKCDSQEMAPPGCLQYFTTPRGMVKSFNYNQLQLNNQDYSVCVRANEGMKRIKWETCGGPYDFFISGGMLAESDPPGMPLGEKMDGSMCITDWVMIFGANKYCGSAFPDSVSVNTQPFMLNVHMDAYEYPPPPALCLPGAVDCPGGPNPDNENVGFCLKYQMLSF